MNYHDVGGVGDLFIFKGGPLHEDSSLSIPLSL